MNPIKLSQQLQNTLANYLTTTFDVNRDKQEPALAKFIKDSFNRPRALFAGPYLELTAPYKTAETLQGLAQEGVVSSRLLQMACFQHNKPLPVDAPLYTHQVKSLRKLCVENRNIVVSSGTGSGKTECFLLPILNDLLKDPSPGVRAVLIYPLNALVNDQLDRLRVLLQGTNITFGRYTSELLPKASKAKEAMKKEWEEMEPARRALFDQYPLPNEIIGRDQIREQGRLPQILITNYAMLEYLLLRPQDSPLFNSGKWRFVVLDEAHSYAGAQGIEVGLLIRRLKHRLKLEAGHMRCIATSATLTDDDADPARDFAEALFGETFTTNDIIFGEPNHHYIPPAAPRQPLVTAYVHPQFDALLHNVRQESWESTDEMALLMLEMGLISEDELSLADTLTPPQFLWETLRGNEDIAQLRRIMTEKGQPVEVTAVAETLFDGRLPSKQRQDAMYHLVELAAMARPDVDEPSLLPARYHLFVRPPQGVWACLNPVCPGKQAEESYSKLFASPRETCDACNAPVYPLVVCRTCGQVYIRMHKVGKTYLPEAAIEENAKKHYLTWRPIHVNRALADEADEDDEDTLIAQTGETALKQTELKLCLKCTQQVKANDKCGCELKSDQVVTLHLLQKERPVKRGNSKGTKNEVVVDMNECGRCHSRALKKTEIATEITMNALTPLAILTDDLYRELPEAKQSSIQRKAGGGRKLLSFYDSRQGAARFAAFVQDVVNQQAYRRIIREAITAVSTPTFLPDLEKVSEACLELALRHRLLHNDPEISKKDLPQNTQSPTQSKQERLIRHMRKQIFAEITTQLRSRQSLEALGLMSVQYFEPDKLPDFEPLAQQLGLTAIETRTLVENLLDELRRGKVVVLPDGVKRDDPIFGRNKFSPRIVRYDASQYEIAWVGKTPRHRRRQLMQKVLQYKGLDSDETAVIDALNKILDWLVDKSDVLDTSRPEDGFQIRQDHLFFQANTSWYRCDQCQRLNYRGNSLPCPHAHCHGTLQPINISELDGDNFYYDNLRQSLVPMRIEEHTAQLDPKKGRDYQNAFKNGDINMLSCSTTFEMGIDLGDLQAVVMSNIPPTVANYKQRAGRAGRRTSGTAFILAWASNRPHDQAYFKTPAEIISGRVRVPYLDVQNKVIIQRHVNAILLSEFLRYCAIQKGYDKKVKVGTFFDEQTPDGSYYSLFSQWLSGQEDYLLQLLGNYADAVKQSVEPQIAIQNFTQNLRQKGYDHYLNVAGFYKDERERLAQKQLILIRENRNQQEINALSDEIKLMGERLRRVQSEDIINHLSDRGILPSYSFPLHVVELRIPPQLLPSQQLRLQRNLQQAIREYAPGQEIVADKRIWQSEALDFFGKVPQIYAYYICPTCNYLHLEETAGKNLDGLEKPCPVCQSPAPRGAASQNQYIQPDGFRASSDSGQPAGQYVDKPFNLMKSALVPFPVSTKSIGSVLSTGYDRSGSLLYVNEGANGNGFRICLQCGKHVRNPRSSKCDGYYNGQPCFGKLGRKEAYTLGFKQNTDTLHLKFSSTSHIVLPEPEDVSFWLSLKYALLQGASRAIQIERRDIEGVLFPEGIGQNWRQTIVLYDSVPGGAGHVKRIEQEIRQVVASALEIVDCDCETSCYRCLREYGNQWVHHLLDRNPVATFLRALDADLQQNSQVDASGMYPVASVNQTVWLWENLRKVDQELILATDTISLNSPTASGDSWLDLIQMLLQSQVSVRLYLRQLPDQMSGESESIAIMTHLRLLLSKGLDLRLTNRLLPYVAIIDANTSNATAIKTTDGDMITFTDEIVAQLQFTQHDDIVHDIWRQMNGYRGRLVEYADLQDPSNIRVAEVKPDDKTYSEADFFSEFYAQPVRSMIVSDRYLDTKEKILNRLGAHIALAEQGGALEWVLVHTRQKQDEQSQAIYQLKAQFPKIKIKFKFDYHTAHDRFIELTRANDHKARLIIGVGLDFIKPNGRVRETFLIFQDM
ncbi:MAG: DEAD/DEAH box helicase [Anaerolineales bacterium]|nr:DEAD/DEAH box helicase [Anaerolineales bacterium]